MASRVLNEKNEDRWGKGNFYTNNGVALIE